MSIGTCDTDLEKIGTLGGSRDARPMELVDKQ